MNVFADDVFEKRLVATGIKDSDRVEGLVTDVSNEQAIITVARIGHQRESDSAKSNGPWRIRPSNQALLRDHQKGLSTFTLVP